MKVTIEGKEYEIDIEKAKELGVIKEDNSIKDFKVGDVFRLHYGGNFIVIIETGYHSFGKERYSFTGLDNVISNYSSFGPEGGTKEDVLKQLNKWKARDAIVFLKNINEDFKKLLKSL